MRVLPVVFLLCLQLDLLSQGDSLRLIELERSISQREAEIEVIRSEIEDIKLEELRASLRASGLPSDDHVEHSGMILSFNNSKHQASWVAHIITPDIINGGIGRTNDFRDDPLVIGEAVEEDYFLKSMQDDGTYVYDGFGFDRGHLAPSADFSWSRKALSESYFYSNISPQHPDFNREAWAELEATLRAYVIRNEVPLYVITLPIFKGNERVIERGVNQLQVPSEFAKVVIDPFNTRGVGFIMDNRPLEGDNSDYAVNIDRVEEITGLDFFQNLDDDSQVEALFNIEDWFPESTWDGVEPIYAPSLPPDHINSTQAKRWMGSQKKVHVCGTVVSTRFSSSGNYWMNVDKKFPNTVFNVYVRKKDFLNFDNIEKDYLLNDKVCFHGKVTAMYGLPNMNIIRQEQITGLD